MPHRTDTEILVVGAGLSGASAAWHYAQAGRDVLVIDQAPEDLTGVALGGASALPVGLMAPLPSHKKTAQAALVRQGIAHTLHHCRELLTEGIDWAPCGSMQRHITQRKKQPGTQLGTEHTRTEWHADAAWIKPHALIRAWLAHPRITTQYACSLEQLSKTPQGWHAHIHHNNSATTTSIRARTVLLALGAHSPAWLQRNQLAAQTQLHTVGGHAIYGAWHDIAPHFPQTENQSKKQATHIHAFNGKGHCIPRVPVTANDRIDVNDSHFWLAGSTYEHGEPLDSETAKEQCVDKLGQLLPELTKHAPDWHQSSTIHAWHGIRCTSPTRMPVVKELDKGLWIKTAMGSRGLSFAALETSQLMLSNLSA